MGLFSRKPEEQLQAERDMAEAARRGDHKEWSDASDRLINAQWDRNRRLRDKGKDAR